MSNGPSDPTDRAVPGVAFHGRAAYLAPADTLILADLHVGRDEASEVSLPLGEESDLRDRLAAAVSRSDPDTVVVAGDVVHTFDGVTARSRDTLDRLHGVCRRAGADLELVAGNHDTALSRAWDGPLHDELVLSGDDDFGRCVVTHGHEPPASEADLYVFGHLHPTIEIEGDRRPCFLYGAGTYRDGGGTDAGDVLCLPAFTRLAPGVEVTDRPASTLDSPLVDDVNRLEPVVYDAETTRALRFPPLSELRRLL